MSNKPFIYQAPFPMGKGNTEHYLLTSDYVGVADFDGETVLKVELEALILPAQQAFHDASFMPRPAHQKQITAILHDPGASENDKYMALQFLRNSEVTARGVLPTCQDTGTAIIVGKKGQCVRTGGGDEEALPKGVYNIYIEDNLRYSQNTALGMYKEINTGTNLPAQVGPYAVDDDEYEFLCAAKGGGSTNKTCLYQETKALLIPGKLKNFLVERMRTLGIATCPPYHIVLMIGDTPAETNLKTVKLASAHHYDELPAEGNKHGQTFYDVQPEQELLEEAQRLGLGTQFDDRYFAHGIHIIRLSCHGASYPVSMDVFCSADRNIEVEINHEGIWIEKLEHNPGQYISQELHQADGDEAVKVDLNHPMRGIPAQLPQYPISIRLSLTGTIIVGRDIVHARLKKLIGAGREFPQYIKDHPIYYAGSAKTPAGYPSGSLGPTTAGCMDSRVDLLQSYGGSMIVLARGNRSQRVIDARHKRGGFYLGSIDGPTAIPAQQSIKHLEYVAHPELGMEAIWKIEVGDFPAFILVDDKGNDLFQQIVNKQRTNCTK